MTTEEANQLKKLVDSLTKVQEVKVDEGETVVEPDRKLPEGKRAVRTKSSGDRVYILDDNISETHPKPTRQWVSGTPNGHPTGPELLKSLGFEMSDVVEVEDSVMMKYSMGPAIFRIDNES